MCLLIHLLMSTIGAKSWAGRAYVCVSIPWTNSWVIRKSSAIPKSDIYKAPLLSSELFGFSLLPIYVSLSFFIKWRKVKRSSTPNSTVRIDVDSENVSLHSVCKSVLSWKLLVSFARPLNNVELSTVKRTPPSSSTRSNFHTMALEYPARPVFVRSAWSEAFELCFKIVARTPCCFTQLGGLFSVDVVDSWEERDTEGVLPLQGEREREKKSPQV